MYFVYVIHSVSAGRWNIGYTIDLGSRLMEHNSGSVRSTKAYRPWRLVYSETMRGSREARHRELQIKSYKGGRAFKQLISR